MPCCQKRASQPVWLGLAGGRNSIPESSERLLACCADLRTRDVGIPFATSFGRVSSTRRHSQRGHGFLDGFVVEPCFLQCLYAISSSVVGRFRYPAIGSGDVVGVWVVAQVFDHVAGEGRREFVMSQTTGQVPGSVAGEPSRPHAASLE